MAQIDLRSDTVTRPTETMQEAMRAAELGDDGREGDPTVRKLEQLGAAHFALYQQGPGQLTLGENLA